MNIRFSELSLSNIISGFCFHCQRAGVTLTRSACVYNGCLAWYNVLLIQRMIVQTWNTVS